MKHFFRKPFLPLLMLLAVLLSSVFMTLYKENIEDGYRQIDAIFANTRLTFQILPKADGAALELLPTTADRVGALAPIGESCRVMQCPYRLCEPIAKNEGNFIYGTDNLPLLAEEYGLKVNFLDTNDLQIKSWDSIPCVMEISLMERLNLQLGEAFSLAPYDGFGGNENAAPIFTMQLIGFFDDPNRMLKSGSLIVSDYAFLSAPNEPKLLYNSNMMYHCYCRSLFLRIDAAYNREYASVQTLIEETLNSDFTVFTNARTLNEAVRPLERKLNMQELLLLPMTVLFAAIAAVSAFLLALSLRKEIFLRFMWGERRTAVFLKLLMRIAVVALCGAGAGALVTLQWFYPALFFVVAMAAAMLPLVHSCRKNLIRFYQLGEV